MSGWQTSGRKDGRMSGLQDGRKEVLEKDINKRSVFGE